MRLTVRPLQARAQWILEQAGIHPLLAQLFASRGVCSAEETDVHLKNLLPPNTLKGTNAAAKLLADTLESKQKICIVADYDCDGATACSVALRGLTLLGFSSQQLTYIVPDRVIDGYGLTPSIAQRVKETGANLLVTVDNGIASIDGVMHAQQLGLKVLVTDHHLPALVQGKTRLPSADVIVNPNQPECTFASKALAGVGVMFYVLLALRAELRKRGAFTAQNQPRLDTLLDLVALGTVADVVKLDANNRRLVAQGLERIRKGKMQPGLAALFKVAGRNAAQANTFDMGFAIGPRLNAAGRLSDMTIGIECLLCQQPRQAQILAEQLDRINRERKDIESDMLERSVALLDEHLQKSQSSSQSPPKPSLLPEQAKSAPPSPTTPYAIAIFDPQFHEGVVGILASRIKEKFYRPAFVFAASQSPEHQGIIKGSGRSIPGFHLRDALDLLEKRHPDLLIRFGGHAMAAGCSIRIENFEKFATAFSQTAQELLDGSLLCHTLETDGPLPAQYCTPQAAQMVQSEVWGNGFLSPVFSEKMEIISQRIVGEKHLALKLRYQQRIIDAIWFRHDQFLTQTHPTLAYRLEVDEWQGSQRMKFIIEGMDE